MTPEQAEPTPEQALVTHIRASTLGGLFREIDGRGPGVRGDLVASLSPPAQAILGEPLGPFQWVETPLINELVLAYEARYGLADIERRVHHTVHQQLSVIHGWMLKLLTAETLFQQAATLYRFNFRGGLAQAEEVRPGRALVSVWSRGIYPSWYTHALPGWLTGALGLVGVTGARVAHHPPREGHRHRYAVEWDR